MDDSVIEDIKKENIKKKGELNTFLFGGCLIEIILSLVIVVLLIILIILIAYILNFENNKHFCNNNNKKLKKKNKKKHHKYPIDISEGPIEKIERIKYFEGDLVFEGIWEIDKVNKYKIIKNKNNLTLEIMNPNLLDICNRTGIISSINSIPQEFNNGELNHAIIKVYENYKEKSGLIEIDKEGRIHIYADLQKNKFKGESINGFSGVNSSIIVNWKMF